MGLVLPLLGVVVGVWGVFTPWPDGVCVAILPALIGGLVGAGASVGSSAMSNEANERMFEKQLEFNREQASLSEGFARQARMDQMVFQREMSNTAYQRAAADMKAAGINPMVAFTQGGASSPSGAGGTGTGASSGGAPQMKGVDFSQILSTAMDTARFEKEMEQRDVDIYRTLQEGNLARATKFLTDERSQSVARENIYATPEHERNARIAKLRLEKATAENDLAANKADAILKRLGTAFGAANSAGQLLRRGPSAGGMKTPSMEQFDKLMRDHYEWKGKGK